MKCPILEKEVGTYNHYRTIVMTDSGVSMKNNIGQCLCNQCGFNQNYDIRVSLDDAKTSELTPSQISKILKFRYCPVSI